MASRVDLPPAEYAKFVDGTRILKLEEAKAYFEKKDGFGSLYGSSAISDRFNLDNDVYKEAQDIDSYIDASITLGM